MQPFAPAFMGLFGRSPLPPRATLSRLLAALDEPFVEALRSVEEHAALARLGPEADVGGLWDRRGTRWIVFALDATRQAARQRALPKTPALPPPQRRWSAGCAPGSTGRKPGEVVRTRPTRVLAHTHQWLFTCGAAGKGDDRGEVVRGLSVIAAYQTALGLLPAQALVRLEGWSGKGAIVVDLLAAGVGLVMRGKDSALLELPQVKKRLALPADEPFTHPESGTCRDLFDGGQGPVTRDAHRARLIGAPHQAATSPIGVIGDQRVYELFFTALPALGFTAALVVTLSLQRGRFETVLADSGSGAGRCSVEFLHGTRKGGLADPLSLGVESAPRTQPTMAAHLDASHRVFPPLKLKRCSAQILLWQSHPSLLHSGHVLREEEAWGDRTFSRSLLAHCGVGKGPRVSPQERRREHDGTVRVLSAARRASCRSCPMRTQCQGHGPSTKKPRRVSAVLYPLPNVAPEDPPPLCLSASASHPLLWGDWARCQPRRAWIGWQRSHLVLVHVSPVSPPGSTSSAPLSRAEPSPLAADMATTARTSYATTSCPTHRDDHLWPLSRVCPVASRLN